MVYLSVVLSLVAIVIAVYYYTTKKENIFEKHGIPYIPPKPLVGNMGHMIMQKCTLMDLMQKPYDIHPEAKYVGFYEFSTPIIVLRDIELIKTVTTKNFEYFQDHRPLIRKETDPLAGGMIFLMNGDEWKEQRNLLSPTFTSSKIKNMFHVMNAIATRFTDGLLRVPEQDREMEMKVLLSKYTTDVIASCVYGCDVDSTKDPKNIFYVYGRLATTMITLRRSLVMLLHRNMPKIAILFKIKFLQRYLEKFFEDLVIDTVKSREQNGIHRPDMLQLMIDTKDKKHGVETGFDTYRIASHAFTFFFGGLDSVSSQACFVTHLFAEHPDVQAKLQEEIDERLEKNNGQITYEMIQEMKYLDAVINETMRLYPVASFMDRLCVKSFELPPTLPGAKPFVVTPGMNLWIPVAAIQRDAKYFEDPLKFNPERFMDDGRRILNSYTFMPFGVGPRMCIGNRFALTQIKVLVCHMLARCNVKVGSKTQIPLQFKGGFINITAKNGFWLKLEPRKNTHPSLRVNEKLNETVNGIYQNGK